MRGYQPQLRQTIDAALARLSAIIAPAVKAELAEAYVRGCGGARGRCRRGGDATQPAVKLHSEKTPLIACGRFIARE
jgi:hypothetical protein